MTETTRTPAETGSAYALTLIALFLLSLLGLTVALVSRTEVTLGNNERTLERVFYAADTGIGVATAKALVVPDNRPLRLELADPVQSPGVTVQNEVEVSPLLPIQDTYCNLCMINQGSQFFRIDHAVTARVERVAWTGGGPRPAEPRVLARKRVTAMIDFQPWQRSIETLAQALEAEGESEIEF